MKKIKLLVTRRLVRRLAIFFFPACLIFVIAGCASTTVTNNGQFLTGPRLPRPSRIWVYDFVASPADLPPGSFITEKELDPAPQTLEQIQAGRDLGSTMAGQLVGQIQRTGLVAFHAQRDSKPEVNDVVFRGYLIAITEGSATKRVVLGFGAGRSELRTVVEGLQMTSQGLRPLGNATLESGGTKTPGASLGAATFLVTANPVGLIVGGSIKAYNEASGRSTVTGRAEKTVEEIAKLLKQQFQEQGWIATEPDSR